MLLLALLGTAQAEIPLPAYDRELGIARWYEVERRFRAACVQDPRTGVYLSCDEEGLRAVIIHADAYQRAVEHTAGLEYQAGLAYNLLEQPVQAIARYRAAVAIDEDVVEAWYDLGELLLEREDFAGAEQAFTHVARLQADDLGAYTGEWRLAEAKAFQHDAAGFETHMREALRRGFSFRNHGVSGLPSWRGFHADPALRASVEKLISVYGDRALIDELSAPAP